MIRINENFLNLKDNYLFSTINQKIEQYKKEYPDRKIIRLGIGDVTKPIVPAVIEAMHKATDELAEGETFRGYGPEQGYDFNKKIMRKKEFQ